MTGRSEGSGRWAGRGAQLEDWAVAVLRRGRMVEERTEVLMLHEVRSGGVVER